MLFVFLAIIGGLALFIALVVVLPLIELWCVTNGRCPDFYMSPFRFLLKGRRNRLISIIKSVCEKIGMEMPEGQVCYFGGPLFYKGLAYVVPASKSKTIFIRKAFLDYLSDDELAWIIAHEIYHLIHPTSDDFQADAFAVSLMGRALGYNALFKVKEFLGGRTNLELCERIVRLATSVG